MSEKRKKRSWQRAKKSASLQSKMDSFVEGMISKHTNHKKELQEAFGTALDMAQYANALRNKTVIQASTKLPQAIEALGEKAAEGDIGAARLLLDICEILPQNTKGVSAHATQVNVNFPTLRDAMVEKEAKTVQIDVEG